jgi:hypothetical protein
MKFLDEIEARLNRATPGPWTMLYTFGSKDLPSAIVHGDESRTILDWTEKSNSSCDDVEFIAHSRTDIEKLLKALRLAITDLKIIEVSEVVQANMSVLSWEPSAANIFAGKSLAEIKKIGSDH